MDLVIGNFNVFPHLKYTVLGWMLSMVYGGLVLCASVCVVIYLRSKEPRRPPARHFASAPPLGYVYVTY
jgi:hypothetical protein